MGFAGGAAKGHRLLSLHFPVQARTLLFTASHLCLRCKHAAGPMDVSAVVALGRAAKHGFASPFCSLEDEANAERLDTRH